MKKTIIATLVIFFSLFFVIRTAHAASTGPTDGYGMYDSCTPWGANDAAHCFKRLDAMAAAGFKLVINYDQMYGNAAGETAYLNHAAADGMKVIFAVNDPSFWNGTNLRTKWPDLASTCGCTTNAGFIQYLIGLIGNNPGLWGYYVADEPSSTNHAAIKTFTDSLTQLDPNHPRLMIESTDYPKNAVSYLSPWADTTDVIGMDYYPVGSWGNGTGGVTDSVPLTATMATAVQSVVNANPGKTGAMVLQSFNWGSNELWRCPPSTTVCPYPTIADMQGQLSYTLANLQPRIILWYSYMNILSSDNPTLRWNNLLSAVFPAPPTVTPVTSTSTPATSSGTVTPVTTGGGGGGGVVITPPDALPTTPIIISGGGGGGGAVPITPTVATSTAITPPLGCTVATAYSPLTGQQCPNYVAVVTTTTNTTFTTNLFFGIRTADVAALQHYLNLHGFVIAPSGPGSLHNETTYFGRATKAALIAFQKAAGIVPDSGYCGPLTRGYINGHV